MELVWEFFYLSFVFGSDIMFLVIFGLKLKQMIVEKLKKIILEKIQNLYEELDFSLAEIELLEAPEKLGDYSCNVAMKLAGRLKKKPIEIAEEIRNKMLFERGIKEFKKIEVAVPGFLNFFLADDYLVNEIGKINMAKLEYASSKKNQGRKIHLDFVSANPTGPIHIGNSRGGPFGDVLAKVWEKTGYQVHREYYVNDFGNQIKVLGDSILKNENAQYKGSYIDELNKKYKNSEEDSFTIGQKATAEILENFIKPSMKKLGIEFDEYFSEKSLHESGAIDKVFERLNEKGLLYQEDGAVWFRAKNFGDEKDRVIRKSTGEVTYFGGDIAYHQNKVDRGFDRLVDIWGCDHHGDIKRLLGVAKALGFDDKIEIIITQMVKFIKGGKEFRMSKRKGEYVTIDDLLKEVGLDAVRFFFLMFDYNSQMVFDLDLAKEKSDKNPVFYVQYAYARIQSILRKAKQAGLTMNQNILIDNETENTFLKEEKERALIVHLTKFPFLVNEISEKYNVHQLVWYVIKLADKFHSFYHQCQVIDEKNEILTKQRLALVNATSNIFLEALNLLGVSAPEKM